MSVNLMSNGTYTLYNVILRIARDFLETRVIINANQDTLTDFHENEAFFFFEKKIKFFASFP